MAGGKIETKTKLENPASRHAAFCKRRSGLFKKASELAILCDAEVALIIIYADGNISEFASSSIQKIVTRFKNCYESGQRCALKSKMEEPKEQVSREIEPRQNTKKHKLRNVLGKDLALMSLDELVVLQEKLNKGLMSIKDRKMKLLKEELEQSRIQEQEVLQRNQILMKQVEDLQALVPQIYYPVPLSVHFPETKGDARTSSREFISSSSLAAPPAITNGPETQHNFQNADTASLPSTANFFVPIEVDYGHLVEPADRASTSSAAPVAVDHRLSPSQQIYTAKPLFHWLPLGVSGANNAPPSGTSSTQLE